MFPGGISNSKLVPLETHVNSRSDIFRIPDLLVVRIPCQTVRHVVKNAPIHALSSIRFRSGLTVWPYLSNQTSNFNDPWETSITIDENSLEIQCLMPQD